MSKGLIRSGSRRGRTPRRVRQGRHSGAYAAANEDAIRKRIRNVSSRARFTQPQRRVVSVARSGPVLEGVTTSQKLAHRIVHELRKAFRGRATYAWSADDGSLLATWERQA